MRQQPRVHPRQPEELLDGHRRHTHTVRVRTDGHIRGRPREHEDPTDDAQAATDGRLRKPRPVRRRGLGGSGRVLRRIRSRGRVGAQDVAASVVRRGGHVAQAAAGTALDKAAQLHADGQRGRGGCRRVTGHGRWRLLATAAAKRVTRHRTLTRIAHSFPLSYNRPGIDHFSLSSPTQYQDFDHAQRFVRFKIKAPTHDSRI
uniref:Uncharacterized protein n=1 Tax=Schizaphis graminum TaxID=13262 RepID=A0A2S2P9V9_SCHGA